jgi:hypothetical protein
MPPKRLAKAGAAIMLGAVLLFWGTGHWLGTRAFEPVNMPIALGAGQINTENFEINLRRHFDVFIDLDNSPDDRSNN